MKMTLALVISVSMIVFSQLIYPSPAWQNVTTTWDQGNGFMFTYDPAFVSSFGRGGVRLSAAPVEDEMYWHGGGIYQNIEPFGYIEVTAKLPKGAGLWPAVFLFNYDTQREIDIFEMIDPNCRNLQFTIHDIHNQAQINHEYVGSVDLSKSYHRYGFRWSSTVLIWYLDGREVWRTDQYIPTEPMDLYLVLSVGGWAGNPNSETPHPAYMEIKSVKVR